MATRRNKPAAVLIEHLRQLGLRKYPGAHLKSPWPGHLDLAVNDKTFAYLSAPDDPCGMSLKLPFSRSIALAIPGASPTAYGLGKSGWVSLSFDDGGDLPPVGLLETWVDESYRAQAPKQLVARLDAADGTPSASHESWSPRTRPTRKRDAKPPAKRKTRSKRR